MTKKEKSVCKSKLKKEFFLNSPWQKWQIIQGWQPERGHAFLLFSIIYPLSMASP